MRKSWLALTQAAVSACLLWFFFKDANLRQQAHRVLGDGELLWLGKGLGSAFVSEGLCAIRWWVMLRALRVPIGLGSVAVFSWAGLFYSIGFPGGAGGDVFRIMYALRFYPKRKARVAVSILGDRLCGWIALFLWFSVACWSEKGRFLEQESVALLFRGGALLLGGTLFLLVFWWVGTLRCVNALWMPEGLRRFRKRTAPFNHGLRILLASRGWICVAVGLSVISLAAHFSTYFCSAKAFSAPLRWGDLCLLMPLVDVLVMLPVTLFGVGLRETLFERLLGALFGMGSASAVLISMGGFLLQALVALAGALCIPFTGTCGEHPSEEKERPREKVSS